MDLSPFQVFMIKCPLDHFERDSSVFELAPRVLDNGNGPGWNMLNLDAHPRIANGLPALVFAGRPYFNFQLIGW